MRHKIFVLVILWSVIQIYSQDNGNITTNNAKDLNDIFNSNETIALRRANYGSVKFEDDFEPQIDESGQSQSIVFDSQTSHGTSVKFEDNPINYGDDVLYTEHTVNHGFTFQDNNNIVNDDFKPPKKKRRRKPKNPNPDYNINIFPDQYDKEPQRDPNNYPGYKPNAPFTFDQQNGPNAPFTFEGGESENNNPKPNIEQANFSSYPQDDQKLGQKPTKKKRRRRRRKPRYQNQSFNQGYPGQFPNGYPGPGNAPQIYPGQNVNEQGYPGNQGYPQGYQPPIAGNPQGFPGQNPYPASGHNGQYYRPPRRPKQSIATEALSAVTGALTSIALYDDYQCVPRLLCEAAGGGALGSSSVLQNIAGLQPLLTLLSAYNGISSSPLFIFGRAVFLGMTAKGNLGTCRYAYPQCPNDPEQLVHYLNNHNGGFFRFFNAPQLNNPQYGLQNVEQFYNQLSQNYGLLQQGPDQLGNQQNYGLYQPNVQNQLNVGNYQPYFPNQQNYGLYQPNIPNQINNGIYPANISPNLQANQGYGFPVGNFNKGPQNYGLQNYGATYPYQNNYGFKRFKSINKEEGQNNIEKRIINGQVDYVSSDNDNPKWSSSEPTQNNVDFNNYRGGKSLRFPGEEVNQQFTTTVSPDNKDVRDGKGFAFPDHQIKYIKTTQSSTPPLPNGYGFYQNNYSIQNKPGLKYVNYPIPLSTSTTALPNGYGFYQNNYRIQNTPERYQPNYYSNNQYTIGIGNQNNNLNNNNDERTETVYIVRGNGDPNHPEIVKLKPGEKLQ